MPVYNARKLICFLNSHHPDYVYLVRQCATFIDWVRLLPLLEQNMGSYFTRCSPLFARYRALRIFVLTAAEPLYPACGVRPRSSPTS